MKKINLKTKIILTIAIFITVNNFGFSQEEEKPNFPISGDIIVETKEKQETVNEKDNLQTVIHIHPLSLFFANNSDGICLYLTIEKPLNLSSSLIIRPSFLLDYLDYEFRGAQGWRADDGLRIGSDFGIRYYPSRKGEGFYFQAQAGVFYINNKEKGDKQYLGVDAMGYLGVSKKLNRLNIFADLGLGYGNSSGGIRSEFRPILDINIGVGLRY